MIISIACHPRNWARVLLERCAAYFGESHVKERLQAKQEVMTMFSGVECARAAWDSIHQAASDLWQIETQVRFICAVPCLKSKPFDATSTTIFMFINRHQFRSFWLVISHHAISTNHFLFSATIMHSRVLGLPPATRWRKINTAASCSQSSTRRIVCSMMCSA